MVPFEALVTTLESESTDMRGRVAQSLGYRGEARGVTPLLAVLGIAALSGRGLLMSGFIGNVR